MTDFSAVETTGQLTIVVEQPEQPDTILVTTTPTHALQVAAAGTQGPPGPIGPVGPEGPQGPHGAGAEQRTYVFAEPAAVWQVTHDLIVEPDVIARDASGRRWYGDESFPTPTTVRIEWAFPMAGTLFLSG